MPGKENIGHYATHSSPDPVKDQLSKLSEQKVAELDEKFNKEEVVFDEEDHARKQENVDEGDQHEVIKITDTEYDKLYRNMRREIKSELNRSMKNYIDKQLEEKLTVDGNVNLFSGPPENKLEIKEQGDQKLNVDPQTTDLNISAEGQINIGEISEELAINDNSLIVEIKKEKNAKTPQYSTEGAAGVDIFSNQIIMIHPKSTQTVSTGIYVSLPKGTYLAINSRSGLAAKNGIFVLNSPGVVDCDYTGEIKVILGNFSNYGYKIHEGDKIAQGILQRYEKIQFEEVKELSDTERGHGGFGSTGR